MVPQILRPSMKREYEASRRKASSSARAKLVRLKGSVASRLDDGSQEEG